MNSYVYIVTEGVQDVYFLGKLLEVVLKLKRVEKRSDLAPGWEHVLPKWPHQDSLRGSVPVPSFFQSAQHGVSVAIVNAEGIDEMSKKLWSHMEVMRLGNVALASVGVVLDADSDEIPLRRFEKIAPAFEKAELPRPDALESVTGMPRVGVYVLPGAGEQGTLEDLLLECAATVYPTLGCRAVRFVDGLDRSAPDFAKGELRALNKPAGRHKAVVAAMGAILKPGRPLQATLEDHRWIEPRTLALSRIQALVGFLVSLVGIPPTVPTNPVGV